MRSRIRPFAPFALALALVGALSVRTDAQTYVLQPAASSYVTGCVGPSLCDCLEAFIGPVSGTFELQPLLPPLGPIFEYDVNAIDWTVDATPDLAVTGSGLLVIDVASQTNTIALDLVVDGVPNLYEYTWTAPIDLSVGLDFGAFFLVGGCTGDGFYLSSIVSDHDFVRGDVNQDGQVDLADAILSLSHLFVPGTAPPACADANDANDDGAFDISDPIFLLSHLFQLGAPPSAPFPDCGPDPTGDGLLCSTSPCP